MASLVYALIRPCSRC